MKLKQLRGVLLEAISHVKTCPVCQGKGFVCEFCKNSNDIIFPFEANKVSTCRGELATPTKPHPLLTYQRPPIQIAGAVFTKSVLLAQHNVPGVNESKKGETFWYC